MFRGNPVPIGARSRCVTGRVLPGLFRYSVQKFDLAPGISGRTHRCTAQDARDPRAGRGNSGLRLNLDMDGLKEITGIVATCTHQ